MKSTGIIRNIDELGRIVVPKEMRKNLGIEEGDPLEIYSEGDSIILKKKQRSCIFCGSDEELSEFKEKYICKECLSDVSK